MPDVVDLAAVRCPRCHGPLRAPGRSRAADTDICPDCATCEAVRHARGLPVIDAVAWPVTTRLSWQMSTPMPVRPVVADEVAAPVLRFQARPVTSR